MDESDFITSSDGAKPFIHAGGSGIQLVQSVRRMNVVTVNHSELENMSSINAESVNQS